MFDGSSHANGLMSLNNCLSVGTNINPNLIELLLGFRLHAMCVTADITKAFLQTVRGDEDL